MRIWISILILSGCSAFAAADGVALDQNIRLFPTDARLGARITLGMPRAYLGEILHELTKQSRVELTVDSDHGPVDGTQMVALVGSRPLRDIMRGLQKLFDTQYDRWEWQASAKRGSYTLRHQRKAADAAVAARQAVFAKWTSDVHTYFEIAKLPADERRERALNRPDLFPGGAVSSGKLDLFASLAPSQVDAVLHGAFVPLELTNLAEGARKALALGVTYPNGMVPEPSTTAGFIVRVNQADIAPILWVRNQHGMESNVVGGSAWDFSWAERESPEWVGRMNQDVNNQYQSIVLNDRSAGERFVAPTLPHWLKEIHVRQKVDMLADLVAPEPTSTTGAAWIGATVKQSCLAVVARARQMWRRDGDLELFRGVNAPSSARAHLTPWATIKRLRASAIRQRGYLGLPDLLQLAQLSSVQRSGLKEEFPDAAASNIRAWLPVLSFFDSLSPDSQRRIASPQGLPIADAGLVAKAVLVMEPPLDPTQGRSPVFDENIAGVDVLRGAADASVSLRMSPGRRLGEEPEGPRLIWTITVPGKPARVRVFRCSARRSLVPDLQETSR